MSVALLSVFEATPLSPHSFENCIEHPEQHVVCFGCCIFTVGGQLLPVADVSDIIRIGGPEPGQIEITHTIPGSQYRDLAFACHHV